MKYQPAYAVVVACHDVWYRVGPSSSRSASVRPSWSRPCFPDHVRARVRAHERTLPAVSLFALPFAADGAWIGPRQLQPPSCVHRNGMWSGSILRFVVRAKTHLSSSLLSSSVSSGFVDLKIAPIRSRPYNQNNRSKKRVDMLWKYHRTLARLYNTSSDTPRSFRILSTT